ncbi:SNF2 helicase associated domain protein [Desulforamulus reducens MI-1]|uniref:SNF2 helicase associated domain protein n=1 Tax=Desulforamulus reducens (strain ATCC BAA-1160 / DSM 100696 / MI-1) TaxID=349161 RepID=A4J9J5_DESRM|nr:DEAD/DEAH box helicase [Desulforamulus reducens]ABO51748.1 SNF2 helicase associated domain protein [Desulforamulus reducens MI-1]
MILLSTKYIQKWCGSPSIYQRGVSYFRQGRVLELIQDFDEDSYYAQVVGSEEYQVVIRLTDHDIDATCDCPAYETYWTCKHIIAVLLEIEQLQREDMGKAPRNIAEPEKNKGASRKYYKAGQLIDSFVNGLNLTEKDKQNHHKQVLTVEYIIKEYFYGLPSRNKLLKIELKVGEKRPYIVKNLREFLQCIEKQDNYYFTKKFTYQPTEHTFLEEDQEIIRILQEINKQEEFYHKQQSYYHSKIEGERLLVIPPMLAEKLFAKLQGRNVTFEEQAGLIFEPYSEECKLPFTFNLEKGSNGDFQIDLTSLERTSYYESYGWLVQNNVVYKLSPTQQSLLDNIYRFLQEPNGNTLQVAQSQIQPFISHVIPGLKKLGRVEIAAQVSNQIISPDLTVKVFVDRQDERILAKIEYHYGDIIIDPFQSAATEKTEKEIILLRQVEKEQEIMKIFENTPLRYNGKECYLDGEDQIYDFLYTSLPKLQEQAELYLTSAVKALIMPKQHASMTKIDINSEGNLLEISFDLEGIDHQEVTHILQSVVEKKKYYRLNSGAFVSLEDEAFREMNHLFEELHLHKGQFKRDVFQLPVYRGLQVESIMNGVNQSSIKLGKKFRRLIQDLKNPDAIDFALPADLNATLREYQQTGFQWLKTMAHYQLGGILADDMGLGKTLQAIAYLLSEKNQDEKKRRTSLVVSPASLVYNWKSEFEKFAPHLDVVVVYGPPEERDRLLRECKPDVFVTSYPLLRQDQDVYAEKEFDSLILDEAQSIKNHLTKTAKAVKRLQAAKRFALSGTPIENSLDELWSLFDAIQPGFFQSQRAFSKLTRDRIARMVRPFILRRVKQDVLRELPEKIETVHQSELTKGQKELYLAYLEKIRQETKDALQIEGFEKSRIKILAGLTRLRQLCCHPSLFLENYSGQSGKLEQLMEIIENTLENKRRLLVFSQFASMLGIICEELDRLNKSYFYLDGQTPAKDRVEMTQRFNNGEKDLFLISLKAGGTGLNLTGADTVILYDLWWNPAIEEQAAGRAHRMGQKNCVQVIKLITKGTIEEKIYEMQQQKKELIEQVIRPGETAMASLSEDDLKEILGI